MSKSRVIAVSTALAIGASALVAPQSFAATIGAKDEVGQCKISYTAEEEKAAKQNHANLYSAYDKAYTNATDSLFPGSRKIIAEFFTDARFKAYESAYAAYYAEKAKGKNASEAALEKAQEAVNKAEKELEPVHRATLDKLVKNGAPEEFAGDLLGTLLEWRIDKLEPGFNDPIRTVIAKADATPTKREDIEKYIVGGKWSGLSEEQNQKFNEYEKADKALQSFVELAIENDAAYVETVKACAAGGNKEVKYPTKVVTKDGSSLPSSIGGEDGSSLKGADGKLTPGAIAGIVIGVLAVLGVAAVAAAPMLGIQLPFELPF